MNPPFVFPSADLLLSAIVNSSEDAIISKNLNSIVMSWNLGAERLFGYTAEEMIGESVARLFPVDRLEEEPRIIERLQRGDRVEHFETVRKRKDGTLVDVSLTISPIYNADREIVGASKIARDISEQKRATRALAEAHDDLKRADQMKAEFLATLSHELRTPLTAILGWIQVLKDGATPAELGEGLEVIERNVRLQSQLIEDLLDMSRIESGKVSLDLQRVDLVAVVEAAIASVRPAAEAKGIRLTCAFTSRGIAVMADKNRLQQVVWNLLTNALKFTPKGGRIHVTVERVNSHIEVAIADTGQGIEPEFLPHVFDRFRQADASITRRHGGLGLGLSIVKNLIELHGGTVTATSGGSGLGATFTLQLPLVSTLQEPAERACDERHTAVDVAAAGGDLRGVKVLAVDDDRDAAQIIRRILERRGAEVSSASSAAEGLVAFERFTPHVVLSDIGMPEHDGYEFITRLRELPGGRRVPAVALTALARSEDRSRALRAGFQMHVAKPVDAAELVAVVQNLAALRAWQSEAGS